MGFIHISLFSFSVVFGFIYFWDPDSGGGAQEFRWERERERSKSSKREEVVNETEESTRKKKQTVESGYVGEQIFLICRAGQILYKDTLYKRESRYIDSFFGNALFRPLLIVFFGCEDLISWVLCEDSLILILILILVLTVIVCVIVARLCVCTERERKIEREIGWERSTARVLRGGMGRDRDRNGGRVRDRDSACVCECGCVWQVTAVYGKCALRWFVQRFHIRQLAVRITWFPGTSSGSSRAGSYDWIPSRMLRS